MAAEWAVARVAVVRAAAELVAAVWAAAGLEVVGWAEEREAVATVVATAAAQTTRSDTSRPVWS